jgi:hypothetical protein
LRRAHLGQSINERHDYPSVGVSKAYGFIEHHSQDRVKIERRGYLAHHPLKRFQRPDTAQLLCTGLEFSLDAGDRRLTLAVGHFDLTPRY